MLQRYTCTLIFLQRSTHKLAVYADYDRGTGKLTIVYTGSNTETIDKGKVTLPTAKLITVQRLAIRNPLIREK